MSEPVSGEKSNEPLSPVKRALIELREMRAQLDAVERARTEPLAVIGLGCRFPGGADDPDAFWDLLCSGTDAITEVPLDRWDAKLHYDPDPTTPGKLSTRWGGFLERVDRFDPHFFGISPREAVSMDPQQRLLLEVTWEALERAGYAPSRLVGTRTGVFVGAATNDYSHLLTKPNELRSLDAYFATGNSDSVSSGRLSYVLGLQGPSMSVDTACSSSLTAVHLACQSLRAGECRMAVAAGVNVILLPDIGVSLSKARMMAPDGRCKTFDARADGFVRAEGCGVAVLKRLSDAVADGDTILAVVRGSAVNQDGRSSGLTVPNGPSQTSVIRDALANGRVQPHEVGYVETHGTGTELGDPIEVQALGAALGVDRPADRPVMLGSVKTNLGHLEAAAGIAGFIKAVLVVQHGVIPPHLHLTELNPHIAWAELPVTVPRTLTPWRESGRRRVAGVSSFGFSGTNVHVVLEQAPPEADDVAAAPPARPQLLALSAKDDVALRELAGRWAKRLGAEPSIELPDVCFTAVAGRAAFSRRVAWVVDSATDAARKLQDFGAGSTPSGTITGEGRAAPRIAFLFPGQGAQYAGMGRQLYANEPVFRAALAECEAALGAALTPTVQAVLRGREATLEATADAQPALFAIEYALAALWRSWGIEPAYVVGHSVGEFAAACVAGALPLEDAIRLVAERGRLMQPLAGRGEMAALFAPLDRVEAAVAGRGASLAVAAINGPTEIVIAGTTADVSAVVRELETAGVRARRLSGGQAFHSPLMEPVLDGVQRAAAGVAAKAPRIGWISTVTGALVTTPIGADYWRRQARQAVLYETALRTLAGHGSQAHVEVGPGVTLTTLGSRAGDASSVWVASLRAGRDERQQMLESAATLWARGAELDARQLGGGDSRRRVALPTYPFQRERYWCGEVSAPPAADPPPTASQAWDRVRAACREQALQAPLDLGAESYAARWQVLDRLTTAQIVHALRALGVFARAGERHTVSQLVERTGIDRTYARLVSRWLGKLAADGLLRVPADGGYESPTPLPDSELDARWAEAHAVLDDVPGLLPYLGRCGERLVGILTGRDTPLETLFPDGSFVTADDLHERWAVPRYLHAIARVAVDAIVRSRPGDAPVRLLELSGGSTGGTTTSLLPVLPPRRTSYWFTDTSEVLLARARSRFHGFPFVRYERLDLDRDPQAQGFGGREFDVVVAANALAGAADAGAALDRVCALLAPGGWLVLYAVTERPAWFDVSIGLIEEKSRRGDPTPTPDRPNPTVGEWRAAFLAHGFETVDAYPQPGIATEILGRHVLIARKPVGETVDTVAGMDVVTADAGETTPAPASSASADATAGSFKQQVAEAAPAARRELLVTYVRNCVVQVLRVEASRVIDRGERLMDMGLDSLMAVELRGLLGAGLGLTRTLSATLMFDYPTIEALARYLETEVVDVPGDAAKVTVVAAPAAAAPVPDPHLADAIGAMSDDDVAALLMRRLESL